jgi:hypothetical protein
VQGLSFSRTNAQPRPGERAGNEEVVDLLLVRHQGES